MDELDVRIFRALGANSNLSTYLTPLKSSIRDVARKLQVDHLTVSARIKRLQESGFLSGWKVLPNPGIFGYRLVVLVVETPPKSPKQDIVRKLKLMHGVVQLSDFVDNSLGVTLLYDSDQSLSRTVELISRITNAENVIRVRVAFPTSTRDGFSQLDWAIVHSLESDALKSYVQVAKEIGYTPRTVKNRFVKMEQGRALSIMPTFDLANVEGMIGLILHFLCAKPETKGALDQAFISHFDGGCLWAALSDPERSYFILLAPTMASARSYLEWARQQPGVASADMKIPSEVINLWNKASELFEPKTLQIVNPRESK